MVIKAGYHLYEGCKYSVEVVARTRAQIGSPLRLRKDNLGPGKEVAGADSMSSKILTTDKSGR